MKKPEFILTICMFCIFMGTESTFSQRISGGVSHALFLCSNSSVMGCGFNSQGELGDGTTVTTSTPVPASSLSDVKGVSAGLFHSLFLKNDGTVWSCGINADGQLGDGTNTDRMNPVKINSLSDVVAICAAGRVSLFLKSDGTVWVCGSNSKGQLGDGTLISKNAPVKLNTLSGIIAISAGESHSLFLKNDNTVWACGANTKGQLGDGTTVDRSTPVQVNSLSGIVAVAAAGAQMGWGHSLFLKNDGTVWACGWNGEGELGDGTTTDKSTPVMLSTISSVAAISAGSESYNGIGNHSIFLKSNGTVFTAGNNFFGELGDGTNVNKSTPVQANALTGIVSVSAGGGFSLFLKAGGIVWACGSNWKGALGDGTTVDRSLPVQVLNLCSVAGIKEAGEEINLCLYPNPTNGNHLTVSLPDYADLIKLKLIDAIGRPVLEKELENGMNFNVDLSQIPEGIFLVEIRNRDALTRVKLIKN